MSTRIENILGSFRKSKTVFCKTGRPEIANDVMGVHQTDVWVILNPVDQWPADKSSRRADRARCPRSLNRHVPGVRLRIHAADRDACG